MEQRDRQKKVAEAQDIARGVEADYTGRKKWAVGELEKRPAVEDYFEDLQNKLSEVTSTLETMRATVMKGENTSKDIPTRTAFMEKKQDAEHLAHHAFAQAEKPDRVRMAQSSFEGAADGFQMRHTAPTERIAKALAGSLSEGEVKKAGDRDLKRLRQIPTILENLPTEELKKLQSEVAESLEELQRALPEVEAIAKDKMLDPAEKDAKLKQYEEMYKVYEKRKGELKEVLEDIEKKAA